MKPTIEELQTELTQIQSNFNEAVQVQRNCERRAIELNALIGYLTPVKKEKKTN
jgi:hypothetical protein